MRSLLLLLLLAPATFGADAAKVAELVHADAIDPAALASAIQSNDAVTRATAARVAAIRDVAAVLPQLRAAVAKEADAEAAREQVRALVLLGNDEDVALAAAQLPRFRSAIDVAFGDALARVGAPRAIELYLEHRSALRRPWFPVELALWRRDTSATAAASRLLGAKDAHAFASLILAHDEAQLTLDAGVTHAALGSKIAGIRAAAVWHLIERYGAAPATLPESLRAAATAVREDAPAREAFGRELLQRMSGAKAIEREEWTRWIPENRRDFTLAAQKFLTEREQKAYASNFTWPPRTSRVEGAAAPKAAFQVPINVPPRLASQILAAERCNRGWLGLASATSDRAGRLQSAVVPDNAGDRGCVNALRTLLRLSFADPSSFTAPLESHPILVARGHNSGASCLDEPPVDDTFFGSAQYVGGAIQPPTATKRVEPHFPEAVRRSLPGGNIVVILEAVIGRDGCVRNIQMVKPSQHPTLNGSSAMALAQWKFTPGTMDGVPVDTVFNMTMNFRW